MSALFSGASANYIPVADVAAATAWYIEKLGLRKVDVELDDGENCVALGFAKDDYASASVLTAVPAKNSPTCSTLPT